MSDWMDELKESLIEEKNRKELQAAEVSNKDSDRRNMMTAVFRELDQQVKIEVMTLNRKLYGERRTLIHGYTDHTDDGLHFLVLLDNLTFRVERNTKTHSIECNLIKPTGRGFQTANTNNGADFQVATDGDNLYFADDHTKTGITIPDISKRLLMTIVKEANN